jgi:uncharacterized membrane protein YbaN (DUF454 family)
MEIKRVLRHVLGWSLVVLGIIGLFLPILQGILFILAGITILAPEIPFFRRLLSELQLRYPSAFKKVEQFRKNYRLMFTKKKKPG